MNELETIKTGDFDKDEKKPIANVGKFFYTWATLGTFAGATFLVSALWRVVKLLRICELEFEHPGWPLLFSAIVIIAFAFATEPVSQKTTKGQKAQKAIITLANTLLVFFTVLGGTKAVSG
jgi:hypothetical protein